MKIFLYSLASILSLALLWCTSLYYFYLARLGRRVRPLQALGPLPTDEAAWPSFTVIIPTYQEEEHIERKLRNTLAFSYPADRWRVLVVDGGSTDRTTKIVEAFARANPQLRLLAGPVRGKTAQLNHTLEQTSSELVMVTDVDGELPADALRRFAALYQDPRLGCTGCYVQPSAALPEDAHFWRQQNGMRLLESALGHSSVVIAVGYTFRRSLFELLPPDVIADDVYVAFRANLDGLKTIYQPDIRAFEHRASTRRRRMFNHKIRKLNANMRELRRFWPDVARMRHPWRLMFVTKFMQSWLVAPLLMLLFGLAISTLLTHGLGALIFWCALLLIGALTQSRAGKLLVATSEASLDEAPRSSAHRSSALSLVLFFAILIAAFFRYFLVTQTSSYRKVS